MSELRNNYESILNEAISEMDFFSQSVGKIKNRTVYFDEGDEEDSDHR